MKTSAIQTAFNAGEFSPEMAGQVLLEKRQSALSEMTNMIPLKQGPAVRRGGTMFLATLKDQAKRTHLLSFRYSVSQNYVIEAGDQYFRFFKDRARVLSGGAPYEVASPYLQADLFTSDNIFRIHTAQSGDVLYLVHGGYAPRALARSADTSWSLSTLVLDDGPYLDVNDTATTLTLSSTSGSVTVTASAATGINGGDGFKATDIGRVLRFKDPANKWTWLTITAWTSATAVTATVSGPAASAGTATTSWRLGAYSDTTGWPRTIAFFQNRIGLFGSDADPDRYDLSESGGYAAGSLFFAPSDPDGTVTDASAISGKIPSGSVNEIQWAAAHIKGFLIGTTAREWLLSSSETNEVITPSNAKADPVSSTGSATIQPVTADSGALFVQRARRRVMDIIYSFEQDSLKPRDLTLAAEHMTRGGVAGMAWQQEPNSILWTWTSDGALRSLTYYPDQQVFGWARHRLGGVSDDSGSAPVVESCAVIPSPDGSRDDLWLIVRRKIYGFTVRYIEWMSRYYQNDMAAQDAVCMDSALTYYDGAPHNAVSGYGHLEGQIVQVLADGRSHPDRTVEGGGFPLANDRIGTVFQIGLRAEWAMESVDLEGGAPTGTGQGKTKKVSGITVRLLDTLGLSFGPDSGNMTEFDFGQGTAFDAATPLFSGDTEFLRFPGKHTKNARWRLSGDGPFPVCVLAVVPEFSTNG